MRSIWNLKTYHIPVVRSYFLWLRGREPVIHYWRAEPQSRRSAAIEIVWVYESSGLYKQKSRTPRQKRKLEELRYWYHYGRIE